MKDYVELSNRHFDKQAKDCDEKDTVYFSKYPKISCKNIASYLDSMNYEKLLDVGGGTGCSGFAKWIEKKIFLS